MESGLRAASVVLVVSVLRDLRLASLVLADLPAVPRARVDFGSDSRELV
jgi:hypothetical protein